MTVHQRAQRETSRDACYTLLVAFPLGLIQPVVVVVQTVRAILSRSCQVHVQLR